MKRTVCLLVIVLGLMCPAGARSSPNPFLPNSPFDEYGRICWEYEKARLDNFAIALLNYPATLGHIIVYDGERACRGEAVARANRAKKYLVEYRKVPPDRIVWRWGGYLNDTMTTLVIHPIGANIWPFVQSLPVDKVTFVGACNRRVRPMKCRPGW